MIIALLAAMLLGPDWVMLGKTGNTLCRRALAADGCTVNFFDVDGDGYAEVLMGGNDRAVHIVRARK